MPKAKTPERIVHTATFLALSWLLIPLIVFTGGIKNPLLIQVPLIVFYLLLLASLLRIANGTATRLLLNTIRGITTIVGVAGLIVLIGVIQDIAGVYCTGLFSARVSCVDRSWFTVGMVLYSGLYIPLILVFGALMSFGLASKRKSASIKNKKTKAPA